MVTNVRVPPNFLFKLQTQCHTHNAGEIRRWWGHRAPLSWSGGLTFLAVLQKSFSLKVELQKGRDTQTYKHTHHLFIHSLDSLNGQGWFRLKLGFWNSKSVSHVGCRNPSSWAIFLFAFTGTLAGSRIENRAARILIGTCILGGDGTVLGFWEHSKKARSLFKFTFELLVKL